MASAGACCAYHSCTYDRLGKKRIAGEQNIVWNTKVYVQAVSRNKRKGLGDFWEAKTSLTGMI